MFYLVDLSTTSALPTTIATGSTTTSLTTFPLPTTPVSTSALTTSVSPVTTVSLSTPGPGDVFYSCSSDIECLTANSDCRNAIICECVAGYSYEPSTKACVTTCPSGYSDSFTLTLGNYVQGHDISSITTDIDTCFDECSANPSCASIDYDILFSECHLSAVTKIDYEYDWYEDMFFDHYQRNCL
ncbi:hypothetical protein ACF0H5_005807 [Mactra antiquata]